MHELHLQQLFDTHYWICRRSRLSAPHTSVGWLGGRAGRLHGPAITADQCEAQLSSAGQVAAPETDDTSSPTHVAPPHPAPTKLAYNTYPLANSDSVFDTKSNNLTPTLKTPYINA
jgi:hypothetical protein